MDLRIVKTKKALHDAFATLAMNERPEEMHITELCAAAQVARKTFYRYYNNIGELEDEVSETLTTEVMGRFTGVFRDDIEAIYRFLDSLDTSYYHLLADTVPTPFEKRFWHAIFITDSFREYLDDPDYGGIAEGYLMSIVRIYDAYRNESQKYIDIKELSDFTTKLLMNGINGVM